ncbi:hypothetical protein D3C87_1610600 [compost metagenome]
MAGPDLPAGADKMLVGHQGMNLPLHVGERAPEGAEEVLVAFVVGDGEAGKAVAGDGVAHRLIDDGDVGNVARMGAIEEALRGVAVAGDDLCFGQCAHFRFPFIWSR